MKKRAIVVIGCAIVAFAFTLAAPRRHVSGDVVPGRYGAFVLACGGGYDLRHLAWIDAHDREGRLPYWAQLDRDQRIVSTFGPGPATIGAVAMLGLGERADDETLRVRERLASAFLIALAAALLVLAAAARCSLRASAGIGAVAALSYAGAATLGQGLWQQTVALPFLVGALATIAWGKPRIVTPALLLVALLLRPAIAPLVLGLGVVWILARPTRRDLALAAGIALVAALPLVAWNVVHLGTPLPLGQATANAALTTESFVFSRAHFGTGLGGLVVSPARGLLWFAPIAIVAIAYAFRSKREHVVIASALVAQIAMMALFYRWWGGVGYGPRLLAEVVWVSIWLVSALEVRRALLGVAIAITIVVGQLGLWRWRAEQWETRRMPDIDENALWDFVDSPILSTFSSGDEQLLALDAPDAPPIAECHLR